MAIRFGTWDSNISLFFAFFVNAAILIVAGAAFHYGPSGGVNVAYISEAYHLIAPAVRLLSNRPRLCSIAKSQIACHALGIAFTPIASKVARASGRLSKASLRSSPGQALDAICWAAYTQMQFSIASRAARINVLQLAPFLALTCRTLLATGRLTGGQNPVRPGSAGQRSELHHHRHPRRPGMLSPPPRPLPDRSIFAHRCSFAANPPCCLAPSAHSTRAPLQEL
jgi:hypothetical protein